MEEKGKVQNSNLLKSNGKEQEHEKDNKQMLNKKTDRIESSNKQENNLTKPRIECPYLGTIKRHYLDFDFEKVCSTSLSDLNVYACLICGKYYQGRATNTHAYIHSLEQDHHLFISLTDQRIFCLPDGYEVIESSLSDIKFNCRPYFSSAEAAALDTKEIISKALDGTDYLPGCIGLNNIKRTDYVNVIIQALSKVTSIRDYFLLYEETNSDLKYDPIGYFIQKWAELFRKIWNPKNFKGQVSPHEVLQAVTVASNNKFKIVEQSDSINFLSWFLNATHESLSKKSKKKNTIISDSFQGKLKVETFKILKDSDKIEYNDRIVEEEGIRYKYEVKEQNFYYLTLDLPITPLFKDSSEKINIPQISIFQLLKKYDGQTFTEDPVKGIKRRYHILTLPQNLILYFKRFEKNMFFMEKNNTIVTFPITNLSFRDYLGENTLSLNYDLVANIIHDGKPEAGSFRVQVKHKSTDKWYDIQDLNINPIMAQSVVVSESYIHIYEGHSTI